MTTDLSTLTDDQLRAAMVKCEADLHEAANIANNTEWHEACFAALYAMCQEANRRCFSPSSPAVTHQGTSNEHRRRNPT